MSRGRWEWAYLFELGLGLWHGCGYGLCGLGEDGWRVVVAVPVGGFARKREGLAICADGRLGFRMFSD